MGTSGPPRPPLETCLTPGCHPVRMNPPNLLVAALLLAADDVDKAFETVAAHDVEVVQEPTDQPYGIRDCAFRDPAGNLVRIQQRASA